MAKPKGKTGKTKVTADEQKTLDAIAALVKKIGDADATEAQSKELKALRGSLGGMKFVRLGKQRTAKAIAQIRNVAKLGGANYARTPEQVKTIADMLQTEVDACVAALQAVGKKEKGTIEVNL